MGSFMDSVKQNLAVAYNPNSVVTAVARPARVRTPELEAALAAKQAEYAAIRERAAQASAAAHAQGGDLTIHYTAVKVPAGSIQMYVPPGAVAVPAGSTSSINPVAVAAAQESEAKPGFLARLFGARPVKSRLNIVKSRNVPMKIATNHMWYDRGDGGSATLVAEARQKLQAARLDAFKRKNGQATVQRTIKDYDAEF